MVDLFLILLTVSRHSWILASWRPPGGLLDARLHFSWRLGVLYLKQKVTVLEGTSGNTWLIS